MRPRSFKPNVLNIPRYVTDYIKHAFYKVHKYLNISYDEETDELDISNANPALLEEIVQWVKDNHPDIGEDIRISFEDLKPKHLRWCFKAPEGMAWVDADYKTAEVFAIAYLSNDQKLINTLNNPDPQFAYKRMPDGSEKPVRIAYIDECVEFTPDAKDPALLTPLDDPDLVRNENGELKHPAHDIHWELCECKYFMNTPREKLDKNLYRDGAGKKGNFSIPYGGSPALLERGIEIATGKKPEPGTGQKVIDAYMGTKPDVAKFLEWCQSLPDGLGYYRAPSGYKRHFKVPPKDDPTMSDYLRQKIIAPLQRQACNVGLQNLVADSLARACYWINRAFDKANMVSRAVIPLYDALYVLSPFNEMDKAREFIQIFMSDKNYWDLPGGRLAFKLDFEESKRWASKATQLEAEEIKQGKLQASLAV